MHRRSGPRGRAATFVLAVVLAAAVAPAAAAPDAEVASAAATRSAPRAVPTCTPGKPVVVGSGSGKLTVTVPGCANEAGLTGYRITVLAGAAEAATSIDVPMGTTQKEVTGLTNGTRYRFRLAARNADGPGPSGVRSADASPPFTTIPSLVDRQYLDFTGAAPTSTQRTTWVNDIASGAKTPIDAVDAAEQQPYWQKQSPIIRLFQAYFLRLPDAGGLNFWVGKYRTGTTLDAISQSFAGSAEFKQRYGTLTNRQFVEQVYLNVLGRPGETAGIDFWTGKLNGGSYTRGRVMTGFSESTEYKNKTREQVWIVNFFTGMIRRLPTGAETATWKPQSRAALIAFLLGSSAYGARVAVTAPPAPPGIGTTVLPGGTVGVAYTANLQAVGSTGDRWWDVASGVLPPGLYLDGDQILGQPTKGGTFAFSLTVEDDNGVSPPRALSIVIPALAVTTTSLPAGAINSPYTATQLTAVNAYGSVTWSLQSGAFPAGVLVSTGGLVSGTPTASGTFNVTVQATDAGGSTATKALAITISNYAILTAATPGGYVGVPYAFALEAAGGTTYTWSLTAGALPGGLTLSPLGVVSGTPTGTANATFTAKVDSPGAKTASKQFTIAVTASADWPQGAHDETQRAWNPGDGAIDSSNVAGIGEEWNLLAALQPTIVGDKVYAAGEVPGRNGTVAVMALHLSTGELDWYGPPLPGGCGGGPVVVTASAVLVQCSTLLAYSRTGNHDLLWNTADTDPGVFTSQLLVAGTTAVTWGSDRVLGYRLSDGQRLWQQLIPSGATSVWDVAASGTSVVVAYDDRIRSLNLTTGAQQWSRPVVSPSEVFVADGWVYARPGGGVSRFALADGTPGWSVLAGTGIYQLVGADADTVYAFEATFGEFGGYQSSVLRALKASDGTQRWEAQIGTRIRSAAITKDLVWIHESDIYAWGRNSNLIAFGRTDGTERKRIHFDDNSYGTAAWGNGHVVFSQGGSFGGPDPYRLRAFGFQPPAPTITTRMVPTGRAGSAYSTQLEGIARAGTLTWSLASGTLPGGLTLSAGGVISAASPTAGSARVQVRATDAKGRSRTRSLFVQVLGAGTNAWGAEGQEAARDGSNDAETAIGRDSAAQLAYRWKTATPAGTEQSIVADHQPVVAGSSVFDVDKIGRLAAYSTAGSTANRSPLWTLTALNGAYYPDAPVESGGTLYLFDSNRHLDAVNATTGARLWHTATAVGPLQYQRNELLVVGTKIVYLDSSYDMVARNTSDGSAAWGGAAVTLDGNELYGSVTLASDGTRAFVVANCVVHAITVATGAVAWPAVPVKEGGTTNCGAGSRMTPMVADGAVFATTYDGSIAIEAATGAVRWRSGTRGGYGNGGGVVANGVWVMANGGADDGWYAALDLATGEVLWQIRDGLAYARLATAGDLLLAGNTYYLWGFDLLTGEKVWDGGTPDTSTYTNGGPIVAAGRVFVSTRDGVKAYGPP